MGNHVVGLQETDDYKFGWESAERGEPLPFWTPQYQEDAQRVEAQQLGWNAYWAEQNSNA